MREKVAETQQQECAQGAPAGWSIWKERLGYHFWAIEFTNQGHYFYMEKCFYQVCFVKQEIEIIAGILPSLFLTLAH